MSVAKLKSRRKSRRHSIIPWETQSHGSRYQSRQFIADDYLSESKMFSKNNQIPWNSKQNWYLWNRNWWNQSSRSQQFYIFNYGPAQLEGLQHNTRNFYYVPQCLKVPASSHPPCLPGQFFFTVDLSLMFIYVSLSYYL